MSGSLTRGGGENAPCIPGACAARSFTYVSKGHCVNMGVLTTFDTCILGHGLLQMPCVVLHHCVLILPMVLIIHKKSRILFPCLRISCSLYSIHKYVPYTLYFICLFYVHQMCTQRITVLMDQICIVRCAPLCVCNERSAMNSIICYD